MTTETKSSRLGRLIQSLIAILSQDWKAIGAIVVDLYGYLARDDANGLFEVLDYDDMLELVDAEGKLAVLHSRVKVRFLQDNVIAFQDYAWGEGNQLAQYKISPGKVVDLYKEGGRWNILVSLRETKGRGDITEFRIERTIKNGFTKDVEWRQTEIWLKFHQIRLSVVFPKDRLCKKAILSERGSKKHKVLDASHFQLLPDGRQILVWERPKPKRAEVYTIRWEW